MSHNQSQKCKICHEKHHLRFCRQFNKLTVLERVNVAKENGYCFNCLCASHTREWCRSRNTCAVCNRNHHTKLHVDRPRGFIKPKTERRKNTSDTSKSTSRASLNDTNMSTFKAQPKRNRVFLTKHSVRESKSNIQDRLGGKSRKHVFLPTALARAITKSGTNKTRLILNSGTTESAILRSFVVRHQLQTTKRGSDEFCTINLQSFHDKAFKVQIHAVVREKLNTTLPEKVKDKILEDTYSHLPDLADPHFYHPVNIDIMIGNDEMPKILKAGLIQTASQMPIAQSTVFGWVISGARYY
ncbi:uncharacterized protein LOC142222319 [Haematobia irritans]|uniref:uncharacterized protein LOC142222319 n=1 Tax=Haematobia irritans TaxID=7368 RepID=UPI003F4FFCFE